MARNIACVREGMLYPAPTADAAPLPVALDSPAWHAWLAGQRSFAFAGANGHFTAQKERRQRGAVYWYAYRKHDGRLRRAYLGKDEALTLAHLEQIAGLIAAPDFDAAQPHATMASAGERLLDASRSGLKDSPLLAGRGADDVALLATKLACPIVPATAVARPRLIARLDESVRYRLTLIVAPAGYGKTMLLGAWSRQRAAPVAWIALDQADNDPARFWRYVSAACARLDASGRSLPVNVGGEDPAQILASLSNWLDELSAIEDDLVLLLDDYQVITNRAIHEAIVFLLDHLPPRLHLIITSRTDPPFPLPRLRARGLLHMIGPGDLRFGYGETVAFLEQTMGLQLADAAITALETRTEGWIAGLQLAALSIREHPDLPGFITGLTGDHRYISDYLITEVFEQQPAEVQDFLLQTSILPRLCASLCEAMIGRPDAQSMLELLERAHLFLAPLDHTRTWFRYHQLFAEALAARLRRTRPELVARLHGQASLWCERNNLPADAIEHALEAHGWLRAMGLIRGICTLFAARGEQATLQRWLETLPQDALETDPSLCVWHAWTLLFNRNIAACERSLHVAVQAWRTSGDLHLLGQISNLRSAIAYFRGEIAESIEYAHAALASLPSDDHFQRALGALYLYHALMQHGKVEAAAQALTEARALSSLGHAADPALRASSIPRDVELAQAALDLQQGRLHQAASLYREILAAADGRLRSTMAAHLGLSKVLRAWDELPQAEHAARSGVDLCRQIGETLSLPDAYVILAHAVAAQGRYEEALAALSAALDAAERAGRHSTVRYVAAQRARIWLCDGRLAEALSWAQDAELPVENVLAYDQLSEYLMLSRVRIAQHRPADVLPLLRRLQSAAEDDGRTSDLLTVLVLIALAYHRGGMTERALPFLERALILARPEGHIRLFVDAGTPMATLLQRAAEQSSVPDYITLLLRAFGSVTSATPPQITPLSQREQEVLLLIAAGASNLEIAERLGLTIFTVKKHVSNIYGKLSVTSRTRAVAMAQDLALV